LSCLIESGRRRYSEREAIFILASCTPAHLDPLAHPCFDLVASQVGPFWPQIGDQEAGNMIGYRRRVIRPEPCIAARYLPDDGVQLLLQIGHDVTDVVLPRLGVRFRQEPQQDAPSSTAIPEGTVVYVIEQLLAPDGEVWWKVRLDDGSLGYIKDRYLAN